MTGFNAAYCTAGKWCRQARVMQYGTCRLGSYRKSADDSPDLPRAQHAKLPASADPTSIQKMTMGLDPCGSHNRLTLAKDCKGFLASTAAS
jgi:hypothetical protein